MEAMTKKIRKLDIKKMEPIAREATRNALKKYIWPPGRDEHLTLGVFLTNSLCTHSRKFSGHRGFAGLRY